MGLDYEPDSDLRMLKVLASNNNHMLAHVSHFISQFDTPDEGRNFCSYVSDFSNKHNNVFGREGSAWKEKSFFLHLFKMQN